jgi:hypothetical protein
LNGGTVTGSATQSNNLTVDPKFLSTTDFHLQSSSPAINTGATLAEVLRDFDGVTRPQGSAYDIGAYEYGGTVATPTPTPTPSGNVFYVSTTGDDSRSCSTAQDPNYPKRTIASGVSCLSAGKTLYIRGGTYNEGLDSNSQTIPTGTSWTNAVTIASYPGETATLRPSGRDTITNLAASYIQYLIFDRLVFDGSGLSGATYESDGRSHNWGHNINSDAHHIRFQNGEIKNVDGVGVAWYGSASGAYSANLEVINSKIYNNRSHGFYISSANNLIAGNDIYSNFGIGVQVYNEDTQSGVNGTIIRNNKIHDNDLIRQWGSALTLNHGQNRQVYNNLIYNNYGGLDVSRSSSNDKIYNNSIVNNQGSVGVFLSTGTSASAIQNNIIWQNSGGTITNNATGSTISNNLTTDPKFLSTIDFHLQSSSSAINTGATLSTVTTDFDGVTRPQGSAYDIGAYEYTGTVPTPDTTAPTLSNITATGITATDATITWTTNENSDSQVVFPTGPCPGGTNCTSPLVSTLTTRTEPLLRQQLRLLLRLAQPSMSQRREAILTPALPLWIQDIRNAILWVPTEPSPV